MSLVYQLLKTLGIWLIAVILLILIVLFPRNDQHLVHGVLEVTQHTFSAQEYTYNILHFFDHLFSKRSLGINRYGNPVEQDIVRYMPASLNLLFVAFILSVIFGLSKGIYDYRSSVKGNYLGQSTTWLLQSFPDFLLILVFQLIIFNLWNASILPKFSLYGHEMWYNTVIVALLLCIYPTLYIARITSSTLASQEDMQYIQTARAKGLFERTILLKHMLGNCWAPIFSHLSSIILFMLSNLLIVEYLMFYQGAADRLYKAMGFHLPEGYVSSTFEPNVVIAFSLCFMVIVLIAQLISQIARFLIDPRIREVD